MGFKLATLLLALATLTSSQSGHAQDLGPGVDAGAIDDLRKFIFNDVARRREVNAPGNGAAKQANDFAEAFPPWATQEIFEIMMMIMSESGEGAMKHANAYGSGGVQGARGSFSPAVNARVDALVKRLEADKNFNNPQNLQKMQQKMPTLPTTGS